MKTLDFASYKDKVAGCWAGKNIGGVLGAPFEAKRQINDTVEFYTQDLSKGPPPNDDLDLQIVWLAAAEKYGRHVNASILGEYWLSFIVPHWAEYGAGKSNMRAGITPPLSAAVDNPYCNSCGCFIRSEIWACLAPGHPEIASKYAFEDASVDHAGEGAFGEVFFAALQSAAFVESDPRELIRIGLSYIPEDSAMARAIREAVKCFDDGASIAEARQRIHATAPGSFGLQICKLSQLSDKDPLTPHGEAGFDAPENCAFTIAGWLYGGGDFGKSICAANSFGEDTDCSCATLGATLGIINGASGLPEKWTKPLDDRIETICIDKSCGVWIPRTTAELSERVMRVTPIFLGRDFCDILAPGGYTIAVREGAELAAEKYKGEHPDFINFLGNPKQLESADYVAQSPFLARYKFPAFDLDIDYEGSVFFKKGEPRAITVTARYNGLTRQPHWVTLTLFTPLGVKLVSGGTATLPLNYLWGSKATARFELDTSEFTGQKLELAVDATLAGRHSSGTVKVMLLPEI